MRAVGFLVLFAAACSTAARTGGTGGTGSGGSGDAPADAGMISLEGDDAGPPVDLALPPFDPDAACASAVETATIEYRPVDIIWIIDNSASMSPAIDAVTQGLNSFAQLVSSASLDYKIIMLSLRSKTNPTTVGGSTRYGVCIPPPLAGGTNCENGTRFFQSSIDVKSTQPLEQLLGTLGQTSGYKMGEEKGGEPWKAELRANATKTIVVVTDDNARLSATDLETFPGGKNPFNSLTLPPGLLDSSWSGLFSDYTFDGIYGWGSPTVASQRCVYADGTSPPSSGVTYTDLVTKTKGVRAHICDGAAAWTPFFQSVATAVAQTSKLTCDLAIPTPQGGTLDPKAVNVAVGSTTLKKVPDAAACGPAGGWYYDDDAAPTRVLLCPTSCDAAQVQAQNGKASIQVQFGCATIIS